MNIGNRRNIPQMSAALTPISTLYTTWGEFSRLLGKPITLNDTSREINLYYELYAMYFGHEAYIIRNKLFEFEFEFVRASHFCIEFVQRKFRLTVRPTERTPGMHT